MLPDGEAARRQRMRKVRHHFLCLIEDLPEQGTKLTPGRMRCVKRLLKMLLKSEFVDFNGCDWVGCFQQTQVANEFQVRRRTLINWLNWARALGLILTTIDTDHRRVPRTTLNFCWRKIAALVGRETLPETPEQSATVTPQSETNGLQSETNALQSATDSPLFASRFAQAPASTRGAPPGWQAVVAVICQGEPGLNRSCFEFARSAGVAAAQLQATWDHYRSRPGAWGAGALWRRIRHAQPGDDPASGWPPPRGQSQPRREKSRYEQATAIWYRTHRQFERPVGMSDDQFFTAREAACNAAVLRAGLSLEDLRTEAEKEVHAQRREASRR